MIKSILRAVDLGMIIQENNERLFWQCQEDWWEEYPGQNDAEIIETLTEQFCAWDEINDMCEECDDDFEFDERIRDECKMIFRKNN